MRTRRLDGAEGDDRHPRETGFRLTALRRPGEDARAMRVEDGEWPGLKKGLAPAGAAGRHLTGYPRETVI